MSFSGLGFQRNSSRPTLKLRPTSKPVTVIGVERLSGSTDARESPAMPRSSNAWPVIVYVPSKTVDPAVYWVVAQLDMAAWFWTKAVGPSFQVVCQEIGTLVV